MISVVIALVFGAGAFLILQRDLFRVVVGIVLISNAANLFIIAAGLTRGEPPVHPLPQGSAVSDPLVQAMALTAIVISMGVTVLLLSLVYRLYVSHRTIDLEDISEMELREAEDLERAGDPEGEEDPSSSPENVELRKRER